MTLNFYLILLIIFIFTIFSSLFSCFYCPVKIKILSIIVLLLLLIRNISLIIMCIVENINYMYLLKPAYFVYIVCIPICIFICMYILIRNDKINFIYVLIFSLLIIITYFISISFAKVYIEMFKYYNLGYVMRLYNPIYTDVFSLSINCSVIVFTIGIISRLKKVEIGPVLLIISAVASVLSILASYININIMPQYLFGELFWVITLNYFLHKVEK